MIKPHNKTDFSELGIWKHSSFVRFLYRIYKETEERNNELTKEIIKLTEVKQITNNKQEEVISKTDDTIEDYFKRTEGNQISNPEPSEKLSRHQK